MAALAPPEAGLAELAAEEPDEQAARPASTRTTAAAGTARVRSFIMPPE
jgi:hypothetical protein